MPIFLPIEILIKWIVKFILEAFVHSTTVVGSPKIVIILRSPCNILLYELYLRVFKSFHSFSVDEKNVGKYNPRKLLRRQDTPRIVESDPVIQVDI